jgi:putative SOS response-associated peptidase YedK
MLTCPPGPDIQPYHDRQIAILPRERWAEWLGPAPGAPSCAPLPAGSLAVTQIR